MNGADNIESVHVFSDPLNSKYFRGRVLFPRDLDRYALLRGELIPPSDLRLGHAEGKVLSEIVWTDSVAVVLISERLADAFRAESFSGWSTYAVHLEAPGITQRYHGLSVTGKCGPLDRSQGEWVHRDDVPGRFLRGMFFDRATWDGSDFFIPEGTSHTFITEQVRHAIADLPNIRCEKTADVLTSELVVRSSERAQQKWLKDQQRH